MPVKRYRPRKADKIEAIQYDGSNGADLALFASTDATIALTAGGLVLATRDGFKLIELGDYLSRSGGIVRHVKGQQFAAVYEEDTP